MSRSTRNSAASALLLGLAIVTSPAAAQRFDRGALERELLEQFEAMRVLREEFPQQFSALLDVGATAADFAAARAAAREWGQRFGQENAILLRSAPADTVRSYLLAQRRSIDTIRDEIGDARCSRWNAGDQALRRVLEDRFKDLYDSIAAITFRAYAAALDRPIPRDPASEADWAALRATFPEHGLGMLMVATLQAEDPEDESGCEATLRFFDAVLALDGAEGDAVRASFAEALARAAAGG